MHERRRGMLKVVSRRSEGAENGVVGMMLRSVLPREKIS